MEKAHWLGRKKAALKMAREASGSESRLIHYDLAGRYGLKAESAQTEALDLEASIPRAIKPDRWASSSEDGDHD